MKIQQAKTMETESAEANKNFTAKNTFSDGAKWQADRSYSEEEVISLLNKRDTHTISNLTTHGGNWLIVEEWFNHFKKK